jgi:excisionase family DNA binding protein
LKTVVTIPEACAVLEIERDVLEQLIIMGKIRDFTLNGKRRIAMDELDRYIAENRTDTKGRKTIMEGGQ